MVACGGSGRPDGRRRVARGLSHRLRPRTVDGGRGREQGADLPGVEQAGPPVHADAPDREGPAERPGRRSATVAVAVAEEQQREGVEQRGGRGLAEEVHRQGAVAAGAQERHEPPEEEVARRQHQRQPERDDLAQPEPDRPREDVEPVGDRVEDRAEPGGLVEPAGEVAVEVVADAHDHQHERPRGRRPRDRAPARGTPAAGPAAGC